MDFLLVPSVGFQHDRRRHLIRMEQKIPLCRNAFNRRYRTNGKANWLGAKIIAAAGKACLFASCSHRLADGLAMANEKTGRKSFALPHTHIKTMVFTKKRTKASDDEWSSAGLPSVLTSEGFYRMFYEQLGCSSRSISLCVTHD